MVLVLRTNYFSNNLYSFHLFIKKYQPIQYEMKNVFKRNTVRSLVYVQYIVARHIVRTDKSLCGPSLVV